MSIDVEFERVKLAMENTLKLIETEITLFYFIGYDLLIVCLCVYVRACVLCLLIFLFHSEQLSFNREPNAGGGYFKLYNRDGISTYM